MWSTIKKILSKEGGNCIVVESDKSVYLIKKLEGQGENSEPEKVDKINQDIAQWQEEKKEDELVEKDESSEIKVEDLPL